MKKRSNIKVRNILGCLVLAMPALVSAEVSWYGQLNRGALSVNDGHEKRLQEYKIEYQYDSIICTGKSAHQLLTPEFNMVNNNINIKNYKENSLIYFLYKKEVIVHRNLTPVIQDLKLNYIIKDDISL